ncbi:carboxylesterase/lipase family protein [Streptomyces sp. NPDC015130]|uniref:carboxylesterase/lipase family protein n=1 Tax=Streptomyces sp. NPDC015130 TaxID=3364940 RepID=UPI0036FF4303
MRHTRNVSKRFVAAALTLAALGTGVGLGAGSATPAQAAGTGGPVVVTTGGSVRGSADSDGVRSFQGIPYAAPPVGGLRWASPRPAASWSGVREATAPGSPCAQPRGLPIGTPSTSEDCLYLNVTTPTQRTGNGKRPVIVWIHGGSLMFGHGDLYGAERLASEGAVVVTVNYRLGVMGFLADPSLRTSGGLGLEDQQAALRWVRANADAFGGDPANVTVMGESGGGYSVCGHLASPKSAGLFHRAIVQSAPCATGGSRTRKAAEDEAEAVLTYLRTTHACTEEEHAEACLRRTDAATLMEAYGTWKEPRPIAGTDLLPLTPAEALRSGRFNRVPVLVGVNHDEERGMVLGQELVSGPMPAEEYEPTIRAEFGVRADAVLARYPLSRFGSAGEALATVRTDHAWSVPTLDTARLLSRWTPTRMFEFSERDTPWWAGLKAPSFAPRAQHMAELPYLFDFRTPLFEKPTEKQRALAERMTDTWVAFARTGRTDWPGFRSGGHVQSLASGPWRRTEFAGDHDYAFWKSLGRG